MIDFYLDCDGSGGIVLIEKDKVKTLSKNLGSVLNVVVDVKGEAELTLDYPDENWENVWAKEVGNLNNMCKDGLMFVGLLKEGQYSIDLDVSHRFSDDEQIGMIEIIDSPLLVVEAGELIQSIIYPQLSLDIVNEVNLSKGKYGVACNITENGFKIAISKVFSSNAVSNVVELSGRSVKSR